GSTLARDDDHPWQPVARATGGLVWYAPADADPSAAEDLRQAYEEWVRPLRLDRLEVDTYSDVELEVPEALAEGEALTGLALDAVPVQRVTLRGELWAEPVQRTLTVSTPAAQLWSALVFGSELLGQLSEAEMMPLALYGGAVSPVTSYLAIEPGVRPSTEGIEYTATGIGFGSVAPRVRMGGTMVSRPP